MFGGYRLFRALDRLYRHLAPGPWNANRQGGHPLNWPLNQVRLGLAIGPSR